MKNSLEARQLEMKLKNLTKPGRGNPARKHWREHKAYLDQELIRNFRRIATASLLDQGLSYHEVAKIITKMGRKPDGSTWKAEDVRVWDERGRPLRE